MTVHIGGSCADDSVVNSLRLGRPPGGEHAAKFDAVKVLLSSGRISAEQIRAAELFAAERDIPLLQALVESKLASQADVIRVTAQEMGLDFVELSDYSLDSRATARLSGVHAKRLNVIPIGWAAEGRLLVAVSITQAHNLMLNDDLVRLTRCKIAFAVALKGDITSKINQVYRAEDELAELSSGIASDADADDLSMLTEVTEEAPIVRFVNLIITQAISDRASDIHIEPTERDLRVRYRIDGVLQEQNRSPRQMIPGVISRLKIMAEINIAERRIPQDGRMSVTHNGQKIDLRVATLPTVWGEKVVMRILDNSTAQLSLDDLGFSTENFTRYRESYIKPYGMILATGPTGSGKSTTLYATLNIVSTTSVNAITVEDPVEYRIPGINQVQVNAKAGLSFATALRSILRSDPDIVLVGEIRDHETAQIAVEAALTGHLVLSTLHTNDAPSAITRLVEMGIEPFLVGSALDCVLAQRLCRRLCPKCKKPADPDTAELVRVGFPWREGEEPPVIYRPVGCSNCSRTGYKGRLALQEVMSVTEDIERLAVGRASAEEITRVARSHGMATLREDGWAKVATGVTSVEEILRVSV